MKRALYFCLGTLGIVSGAAWCGVALFIGLKVPGTDLQVIQVVWNLGLSGIFIVFGLHWLARGKGHTGPSPIDNTDIDEK